MKTFYYLVRNYVQYKTFCDKLITLYIIIAIFSYIVSNYVRKMIFIIRKLYMVMSEPIDVTISKPESAFF